MKKSIYITLILVISVLIIGLFYYQKNYRVKTSRNIHSKYSQREKHDRIYRKYFHNDNKFCEKYSLNKNQTENINKISDEYKKRYEKLLNNQSILSEQLKDELENRDVDMQNVRKILEEIASNQVEIRIIAIERQIKMKKFIESSYDNSK